LADSEKNGLRYNLASGGAAMKIGVALRMSGFLALLLALAVAGPAVSAGPFNVNSTSDHVDLSPGNGVCQDSTGQCSLRAAVMEANALPGADTIVLPSGTFNVQLPGNNEDAGLTGDLDLTGTLTLRGAGSGLTIVDAALLHDRVFDVLTGAQVSLSDLTIQHGIIPTAAISKNITVAVFNPLRIHGATPRSVLGSPCREE
jgi:CSLREA domain-containing protein